MSVHEANKMIRVLKGERLKYTVRIHMPDETILEFQSENRPIVKYNDEDRNLWIVQAAYGSEPVMRFKEGMIILCEENPVVVAKNP